MRDLFYYLLEVAIRFTIYFGMNFLLGFQTTVLIGIVDILTRVDKKPS